MQCCLTTAGPQNQSSPPNLKLELEESLVEVGPYKTDPMEEQGLSAPYGQDRLPFQRETKRRV